MAARAPKWLFLSVPMCILFLMQSFRKHLVHYFLGALFFANIFIWYAVFVEERNDVLTVAFLDVGQGDAIFIEAPNGNQMLIDGGKNTRALRELSSIMPFYDHSIDVILATHPDQDHIGGLPSVFERFQVDYFIESGVQTPTGVYQALTRVVTLEGSKNILARRGMKIFLDDSAYVLVLFPDRDARGMDTNDASIVAKLIYGDTSFLFVGDSPEKIEKYIASLDGKKLHSTVLKVGHHGSKTSTSELFLGFVSPEVSVISSGIKNSYGHPHAEVTNRLLDFGSAILRTDERGTIVIKSDGTTLRY